MASAAASVPFNQILVQLDSSSFNSIVVWTPRFLRSEKSVEHNGKLLVQRLSFDAPQESWSLLMVARNCSRQYCQGSLPVLEPAGKRMKVFNKTPAKYSLMGFDKLSASDRLAYGRLILFSFRSFWLHSFSSLFSRSPL